MREKRGRNGKEEIKTLIVRGKKRTGGRGAWGEGGGRKEKKKEAVR